MAKVSATELVGDRAAIYQAKSGKIEFRGDPRRDTVWGNLNQIAALFGRDKSVISRHINNIFKSGELARPQLLQFLQQLPRMAKLTKSNTTTST